MVPPGTQTLSPLALPPLMSGLSSCGYHFKIAAPLGVMSVSQTRRRASSKDQPLSFDSALHWAGYSSWIMDACHTAPPSRKGCWGHKHFIFSIIYTSECKKRGAIWDSQSPSSPSAIALFNFFTGGMII